MTSTITGVSQTTQVYSSGGQGQRAQIEAQIKAKETEAESVTEPVAAAKLSQEIAVLKAKLAALDAAEQKAAAPAAPPQPTDPAQQAGFDAEDEETTGKSYII